ncbi:MAG: phosphoglycerate kinase [Acidobacteria bacterium]|nr:phosphoglycerate kinase [Acidobacteriota bacterium]
MKTGTKLDKLTLRDVKVTGKRVLVRVDFNVTLDKAGKIVDAFRIKEVLPTIRYLHKHRAKVILCSHFGRPEKPEDFKRFSMGRVGRELSTLLGSTVPVASDCIGPEVEARVGRLREGEILLLENLRFHPEEERNDLEFAKRLASLGEIFVNDAFATAHRSHASVVTVPGLMRVAVAGLLMQKEIGYLKRLASRPKRPYGAVFGGAKISDKIRILRHFLTIADVIVVGGAMANTLLKAQGLNVGKSLVQDDWLHEASLVLKEARKVTLLLPSDVSVVRGPDDDGPDRIVSIDRVEDDDRILDIGPDTVKRFARALRGCKTIIWNGPMGKFEVKRFEEGSRLLAEEIGKIKALSVAGGGDTSALHRVPDLIENFDYVSTGGAAFLEFLEGHEMPGIEALSSRPRRRPARTKSARKTAPRVARR